jgi:hypothetical protein
LCKIEPEPQERPLSIYTGGYRYPGYGGIEVRVKDVALSIDRNDRSLAVEMNFEFLLEEEMEFVAYLGCPTERLYALTDVVAN